MSWWARSRRLPYLATAVAGYVLLLALVSDEQLPVISFTEAAAASVHFALLAPLLVAGTVVAVLAGGDRHAEALAARPVWPWDAALAGAVVVCCAAGTWLLGDLQPHAAQATRNLVGFLGIALLLRTVVGERAAVVLTTVVVLVSIAFGYGEAGLRPWAWLLADGRSVPAAVAALLLAAGGVAALAVTSRAPSITRLRDD